MDVRIDSAEKFIDILCNRYFSTSLHQISAKHSRTLCVSRKILIDNPYLDQLFSLVVKSKDGKMCLTFIQRIRKYEDLYQYVLQNEHSQGELRQMVLKLLHENRSLLRECYRIARKLAQCMKLVFTLEDTLYLTMSQEVLKDTVTLPDCLKKIKRYLDITKMFVERTESLVTVNYNLDEESGRIISSSLQEMKTIKRVVERLNTKLRNSHCANGTVPVERNQSSSYTSDSNMHKRRPGRPRKYSKLSSSSSASKQHKKYKKNVMICSSVEQSETEDNSINDLSHEIAKKNELIEYKRQSIDSHEESSSDDESQIEESFPKISASCKQRSSTKRKLSSGLEQENKETYDLAESSKGQNQGKMYKSSVLRSQKIERARQSSHDKSSSSEEELQIRDISGSVKPKKRGRGRPKQTPKRQRREYSEAYWHWYWSVKRDTYLCHNREKKQKKDNISKPCSVVLIDVLKDPAAERFIGKLKQNKLSDTLKECEAFSGREEFKVLDTVGQSDEDFEASSQNENSESEMEIYTINGKRVPSLKSTQPYNHEVSDLSDEHGNSDHADNENIDEGKILSKSKEIRPVNRDFLPLPMSGVSDLSEDNEPKNKKYKPMNVPDTLTYKPKISDLSEDNDNSNYAGNENVDNKGKIHSKIEDSRPSQSNISDITNLSDVNNHANHDSEETVIESLGHSQVGSYEDTVSVLDEDNCCKVHEAAANEDEGSYVDEKKDDPDGKGPLTLPLPAFAKRCRGPYTPPGSPPVTDGPSCGNSWMPDDEMWEIEEFSSEDDFE